MTASDSDFSTAIIERIGHAMERANLGQRALANTAGLSQSTLSRILSGTRVPKLPEIVAIARATGASVSELTGTGRIADRVQGAARAVDGAGMEEMRRELLHYLELDAYLDDQAIPAVG